MKGSIGTPTSLDRMTYQQKKDLGARLKYIESRIERRRALKAKSVPSEMPIASVILVKKS